MTQVKDLSQQTLDDIRQEEIEGVGVSENDTPSSKQDAK